MSDPPIDDITKVRRDLYYAAQTIDAIQTAKGAVASRTLYQLPKTVIDAEVRHTQKFLSAVCLLAANRRGWKSVSAACIEEDFTELTGRADHRISPNIVIRLAQNEIIQQDVDNLQLIMDNIVGTVNGEEGKKWRKKKSEAVYAEVFEFAANQVVPLIVKHCYTKLKTLVDHRHVVFKECWEDIKKHDSQDELHAFKNPLDQFCEYFEDFDKGFGVVLPRLNTMVYLAAGITATKKNVLTLDAIWRRILRGQDATSTDNEIDDNEEDDHTEDDEDEIADSSPDGKASCLVVRFLKTFARYSNIGITLFTSSFELSKKFNPRNDPDRQAISICIKPVPRIPGCTPVELKEVTSEKEFCLEDWVKQLGISGKLESGSREHLSKWLKKERKTPLYVHAEVMIAIFYCLHDKLAPIFGFVGVSKYCCYTCNLFLKHIQLYHGRDQQTMFFFVKGTHGTIYDSWLFPFPELDLVDDCVRKLLKGLASDLQKALTDKARQLIEQHGKHADNHSESSGDSEYDDILAQVYLKAAANSSRKH